jgi:hypothetical protein
MDRRTFDGTYLRNNRKQSEQQTYPGGMPTEHHQHKHGQLDGGPHRLQTCQQRGPRHYSSSLSKYTVYCERLRPSITSF